MKKTATVGSMPQRFTFSSFVLSKKKIAATCAFLLAVLFIYAAYNKLSIYSTFLLQLKEYPFFNDFANIMVWGVPGIEILIALLLIVPRTRLAGLYSSFFLMLAFTVFIYWLQHFTTYKSCSCGGIISGFNWTQHFWFNIAFTTIAGLGVCLQPDRKQA